MLTQNQSYFSSHPRRFIPFPVESSCWRRQNVETGATGNIWYSCYSRSQPSSSSPEITGFGDRLVDCGSKRSLLKPLKVDNDFNCVGRSSTMSSFSSRPDLRADLHSCSPLDQNLYYHHQPSTPQRSVDRTERARSTPTSITSSFDDDCDLITAVPSHQCIGRLPVGSQSDFTAVDWRSIDMATSRAIARRNERERNRVRTINQTFARLRQHLPPSAAAAVTSSVTSMTKSEVDGNKTTDGHGSIVSKSVVKPAAGSGGSVVRPPVVRSKKLSKVQILRAAIEYIARLQKALQQQQQSVTASEAHNNDVYNSSSEGGRMLRRNRQRQQEADGDDEATFSMSNKDDFETVSQNGKCYHI